MSCPAPDPRSDAPDSEGPTHPLQDGSSAAPSNPTGPTHAQRIVGRIGQTCAVWWVVMVFLPTGGGEPTDWGELVILGGGVALVVAVPLWAVATGVRSAHRSTRLVCAWCALPGVVLPTFLIIGNWSTSTGSARLLWFITSGPVIAACLAICVVTLVSEHERGRMADSRRPHGTGVNLSEPWTRWSLVAVVGVAITLVILGAVAKQQAPVIEHGTWTEPNAALLSPDNEFKFYGAAVAIVVIGLFGVWAASRFHGTGPTDAQ